MNKDIVEFELGGGNFSDLNNFIHSIEIEKLDESPQKTD